jgi:2,4-diaminopentanoate dehydrogenase
VIRVAQWATGNIGLRSLQAVIEHPGLELVGLYVYSDEKDGRDAGEMCGLAAVGVRATRDIEEILSLGADCCIYMGDRPDFDSIARLLESGCNVVTTRAEFARPADMDAGIRARIEAACQRGSTSIHSTGSSPGFITEALPFVLASLERRLDRLSIDEFADMSSRNSPELMFNLMGFGRHPATFSPEGMAHHGRMAFGPSMSMVADAIGRPFEEVVATGEVAVARTDLQIAAGRVKAGTIAAQRMIIEGRHGAQPVLRFRSNWYLTTDVEPAWDLRETGWLVQVEGDVPLEVSIRFPVAPEDWAATSPAVTANRPVNAVPYVCAARPGIITTAELPQVIPDLTRP